MVCCPSSSGVAFLRSLCTQAPIALFCHLSVERSRELNTESYRSYLSAKQPVLFPFRPMER